MYVTFLPPSCQKHTQMNRSSFGGGLDLIVFDVHHIHAKRCESQAVKFYFRLSLDLADIVFSLSRLQDDRPIQLLINLIWV